MIIDRLCIIGVGLIGGSLARSLRNAGACNEIVGCSRDSRHLEAAVKLGVIDRYDIDPATAVKDADMVVIAVPLGALESVFRAIEPGLKDGCVVTDVGSAKMCVIEAAKNAYGSVPPWFVPGHPIAGNERSGVEAAVTDLFEHRRVILTPLDQTNRDAVQKVRSVWEAAGAQVTEMQAEHHDEVLAATSHLPHVLAFNLVESLSRLDDSREVFQYAAGGFRDFTRIAASDPVMWRDICLSNRKALLDMIGRYSDDLEKLAQAVREEDGEMLLELFQRAQQARLRFGSDNS